MENLNLAKKVKELRTRKGLSQEQLAETSGLSLRTIQRIENHETAPNGDTLKKLAAALQVSPDEIIDWQIVEDRNVLTLLNLSQLGFMVFIFLGIIIPLVIWILKRDKVNHVDELGKQILNFQITWVILLFVLCGGVLINQFFQLGIPISFFGIIATIVGLFLYHVVIVLVNTIRCHNEKSVHYFPAFHFLR